MKPVTGYQCKLYIASALGGTMSYTEIKGCGDVTLDDLTREEVEVPMRGLQWKLKLPSILNAPSVTFKFVHGIDSSMESTLKTHFTTGDTFMIVFAYGDIATAGTDYFQFPCFLSQMNATQNLTEASEYDCKVSFTYGEYSSSQVMPSWGTVSAGTTP